MTKKVSKKEREFKEFKAWLEIQVRGRLEDGSLKQGDIVSYTKGAYKVYDNRPV